VVIAGPDREDVGLLVFPNSAEVEALAPGLSFADALTDARVKAAFRDLMRKQAARATGSSSRVARLALLALPPSIDLGEVTDKGSLNQRALLANRAADVEAMYAEEAAPHVVRRPSPSPALAGEGRGEGVSTGPPHRG
jgi:feruloyl-CoA synthase